jgi:Ca2+-binding EF-hand superfamily protein
MTPERLEQLLMEADKNNDGEMSKDEFKELLIGYVGAQSESKA